LQKDPLFDAPASLLRNASRRSTTGPVGALLCASPDVQREGQPAADCEFCSRAVLCPMLLRLYLLHTPLTHSTHHSVILLTCTAPLVRRFGCSSVRLRPKGSLKSTSAQSRACVCRSTHTHARTYTHILSRYLNCCWWLLTARVCLRRTALLTLLSRFGCELTAFC
jgi:hypothetical protein